MVRGYPTIEALASFLLLLLLSLFASVDGRRFVVHHRLPDRYDPVVHRRLLDPYDPCRRQTNWCRFVILLGRHHQFLTWHAILKCLPALAAIVDPLTAEQSETMRIQVHAT